MPLLGAGVTGLALFALWLFCVIDVVTTDDTRCRNLPKIAWLLIVVLLPLAGSIVWLVAGRPRRTAVRRSHPADPMSGRFPEYDRPGRHISANPDDDAEFLRRCRERAEQQRRAAERRKQADEDPA